MAAKLTMLNTRCIRYTVDPRLLNEGIPIECLKRKNQQTLGEPEKLTSYVQSAILRAKSATGEYPRGELCPSKGVELPKPPDRLEIELTLTDYSKVKAGQLIKISPEIAKHNGERFKIRNKGTNSYVVRSLVVVGERGYFR